MSSVCILSMDLTKYIQAARDAKEGGYQKYSDYSVGAVLVTTNGEVYKGSNIETATFDMCIHAERSAVDGALTQGIPPEKFNLMVISTEDQNGEPPCGTCRQFLADFCSDDFSIYSDTGDIENPSEYSLGEIFPHAFRPEL